MAKSKTPPVKRRLTIGERWKRWISKNEKILWVGLLVLIAPLMAFTFPVASFFSGQDVLVARYYGEDVRKSDLESANGVLRAVSKVAPGALTGKEDLIGGGGRGRDFNPLGYLLHKRTADRLGIRVSDEELADHIRELWRDAKATEWAREEIAAAPPPPGQNAYIQFFTKKFEKKLAELRENGVFDPADWKKQIAASKVAVYKFENGLRDIYVIGKLQRYIESTVKVTEKDVYEEFRKKDQKRQLSWTTWRPGEALQTKIAPSVTAIDLRAYYQANRADFFEPVAVRPSYLLVPKEHFEKEVVASVKREELEEYYEENRNDYRSGAILAEDGVFALRTAAEQAAIDAKLYQSFAAAEADVREKYVEKKVTRRVLEVSREIRDKLFPTARADAEPAKVEDLLKEYPFLVAGQAGFAKEDDATEVLGEYWSRDVARWFRELNPRQGQQRRTSVEPQRRGQVVDAGRLFYTALEVRLPNRPALETVKDKVRDAVVQERALDAIDTAITAALGDLTGEALAAKMKELVEKGVEVPAGDGTTLIRADGDVFVASAEFVGRYGVVRYRPDGSDEAEDEVESEDEPKGETHSSTGVLRNAAFSIAEIAGFEIAIDSKEDAVYVVRYDEVEWPDPADFDKSKDRYQREVLQRERGIYFAEWRRDIRRQHDEAYAQEIEEAPEPESESAG